MIILHSPHSPFTVTQPVLGMLETGVSLKSLVSVVSFAGARTAVSSSAFTTIEQLVSGQLALTTVN